MACHSAPGREFGPLFGFLAECYESMHALVDSSGVGRWRAVPKSNCRLNLASSYRNNDQSVEFLAFDVGNAPRAQLLDDARQCVGMSYDQNRLVVMLLNFLYELCSIRFRNNSGFKMKLGRNRSGGLLCPFVIAGKNRRDVCILQCLRQTLRPLLTSFTQQRIICRRCSIGVTHKKNDSLGPRG